jgi:DNA-binding winged helix-turn-helix (wHTH) protein
LTRDGAPVALNGRYFDALALLVSEQGRLVTKERFLEEVWRGVPVTDEALTQCVRTLRRRLEDDAVRPRFIETAPKHGYRFIAPVEIEAEAGSPTPTAGIGHTSPDLPAGPLGPWRRMLALGGAGTLGGGAAGIYGGIAYGLLSASEPLQPGTGATSVLLVLVCLTMAVGILGGAGVGFGIAAANLRQHRPGPWSIVGGAAGGLLVGAMVKLVGLDAFNLLFGRSPGEITGAPEGLLLGGAVGLSAWVGDRMAGENRLRRGVALAALVCGAAGVAIPLLGGRLMGGSLELLARFPESRLRLDHIGALFGEDGFGPASLATASGLEAALFGAFVTGAMILARRNLDRDGEMGRQAAGTPQTAAPLARHD